MSAKVVEWVDLHLIEGPLHGQHDSAPINLGGRAPTVINRIVPEKGAHAYARVPGAVLPSGRLVYRWAGEA